MRAGGGHRGRPPLLLGLCLHGSRALLPCSCLNILYNMGLFFPSEMNQTLFTLFSFFTLHLPEGGAQSP